MVGGDGEGGGGDSEPRVRTMNIVFIPVEFFYCESRLLCVKRHLFMTIVQTQCCQFLKFFN